MQSWLQSSELRDLSGSVQLLVPAPDTATPARTISSASPKHILFRRAPLPVCVSRGGLHNHQRRFTPPSYLHTKSGEIWDWCYHSLRSSLAGENREGFKNNVGISSYSTVIAWI